MSRPLYPAPSHAALFQQLCTDVEAGFADAPRRWEPTRTGLEDSGRGMLDAFSLGLSVLWLYQQHWADEALLPTAQLNSSVERILGQLGYQPSPGTAAFAFQQFEVREPVVLPQGFAVLSPPKGTEPEATFETLHVLRAHPALNLFRASASVEAALPTQAAAPVATSANVSAANNVSEALKGWLDSARGDAAAAAKASQARQDLLKARDFLRLLEDKGVTLDTSTKEVLCKAMCGSAHAAADNLDASAPVESTPAQELLAAELDRLASKEPALFAGLNSTLKACGKDKPLKGAAGLSAERVAGLVPLLEALVAGVEQASRDRFARLHGTEVLNMLDRTARLGLKAPTLPAGATRLSITWPSEQPDLRPGDWLILGSEVSRLGTDGKPTLDRSWRQAIRITQIRNEVLRSDLVFEPALQQKIRLDQLILAGNIALVSEGSTVTESLQGSSPLLTLGRGPLTWILDPAAPAGRRPEVQLSVNGRAWQRVDTLLDGSPNGPNFAVECSPGGGARLRTGAGGLGASLPENASLQLRYRVGLGAGGNRAAGRIDGRRSDHPALLRTQNLLPAWGGADPEDRALARSRAPAALRAVDRVVSLPDLRAAALSFDGVSRARVFSDPRQPRRFSVVVCGAGNQALSAAVHRDLRRFLEERTPPGIQVATLDPVPLPIALGLRVRVIPGTDPVLLEREIRLRLGLDSEIGRAPGLLDPRRVDLDADLQLSAVYGALEGLAGVRGLVVTHLGSSQKVADRIQTRPVEIPVWAAFTLRIEEAPEV